MFVDTLRKIDTSFLFELIFYILGHTLDIKKMLFLFSIKSRERESSS